jgi:hypothetical protein
MFRWCRISVWFAILVLVTLVLWSNYVAVPEFIASPLRSELRRHNVALEFTRLRLSGFRRVIAERLSITPVSATNSSRVDLSQAELKFRYGGSPREPVAISGLRLNEGQLAVAINEPGAPSRFFSITNLHADIEFKRDDTLRIVNLSGDLFGARANISGSLRNFSEFRLAEPPPAGEARHWRKQLAEVMDIADQLTFAAQPELTLSFNADARDWPRTRASVSFRADEGVSRWGGFHRLRLNSALTPLTNEPALKGNFIFDLSDLGSDTLNLAAIHLEAESKWSSDMQKLITNHVKLKAASARFGSVSAPDVRAELASGPRPDGISSRIDLESSALKLGETEIQQTAFHSTLQHPLPFSTPANFLGNFLSLGPGAAPAQHKQQITGQWNFQSGRTRLPRANADSVIASGEITTRTLDETPDPTLAFWEFFRPFELPWQLQLSNLTAGDVAIGTLAARGHWDFPELDVAEIKADLYKGKLNGHAGLDVITRQFTAFTETTFDYHQASVLLDPPVQRWLEQFAWENPPFIETELAFQAPPWTNTWNAQDILPSITMSGRFEGRGSFRGIPLGLAQSHFTFTNYVWALPDLKITRPEGMAILSYIGNVTNQVIAASLESQIDPSILSPAFDKSLQPAFEMLRFTRPPLIRAEIRGDLDDLSTVTARGSIAATNFFAKEQALTDIRTDFFYKNQSLELNDLVVHRGTEEVHAPFVKIDFPNEVMFVTNAVSTIDPYIAMSLVGDEVYDAIDPYRFANAPTVTINGIVPLRQVAKADIHFGVSGTEFTFWRFNLPALSGDVFWRGFDLSLSNVHAAFYDGTAEWSGHFKIDERKGSNAAQFSFRGVATNASLLPLVRDLFATTNRLEGTFGGELVITSANTTNIESWSGFGHAALKDGYLWSIPIFGVFSPGDGCGRTGPRPLARELRRGQFHDYEQRGPHP